MGCFSAESSPRKVPEKQTANSNRRCGANCRLRTQVMMARSIPPNRLPLCRCKTEVCREQSRAAAIARKQLLISAEALNVHTLLQITRVDKSESRTGL